MLAHLSKCEARAVIVVPNTRASWFPTIEGAGVRSVQLHPRARAASPYGTPRAEPYTFGRGGMRAVEVDFRGVI